MKYFYQTLATLASFIPMTLPSKSTSPPLDSLWTLVRSNSGWSALAPSWIPHRSQASVYLISWNSSGHGHRPNPMTLLVRQHQPGGGRFDDRSKFCSLFLCSTNVLLRVHDNHPQDAGSVHFYIEEAALKVVS